VQQQQQQQQEQELLQNIPANPGNPAAVAVAAVAASIGAGKKLSAKKGKQVSKPPHLSPAVKQARSKPARGYFTEFASTPEGGISVRTIPKKRKSSSGNHISTPKRRIISDDSE
jgi:hypothetical protein